MINFRSSQCLTVYSFRDAKTARNALVEISLIQLDIINTFSDNSSEMCHGECKLWSRAGFPGMTQYPVPQYSVHTPNPRWTKQNRSPQNNLFTLISPCPRSPPNPLKSAQTHPSSCIAENLQSPVFDQTKPCTKKTPVRAVSRKSLDTRS